MTCSQTNDGIRITDVSVFRRRYPILRDLNLVVANGETIAIMGANGAGKSTLLACLAGALRLSKGHIRVFGNRPNCLATKKRVGSVGHHTGLYGDLTVWENLLFAARMHGIDSPRNRALALLSESGLQRLKDHPVLQLSQGAQRRAAIARAMIHEPQLLLLDEPFATLDTEAITWLENCFQHWRKTGRTVFYVSHDSKQASRLADRAVWLNAGQILLRPLTDSITYSKQSA